MKMPRGLSSDEVMKRLQRAGWQVDGHKGGHTVLCKKGHVIRIHLPHRNYLRVGTLADILHAADMTLDEFERLKR